MLSSSSWCKNVRVGLGPDVLDERAEIPLEDHEVPDGAGAREEVQAGHERPEPSI